MGRIKGRKPEHTRGTVLEAATAAFAERGFTNATLSMIASRAGVTAATLPYHFGDKQGLYDAVISNIYGQVIAFIPEMRETADFTQMVMQVYGWAERHRDAIRVMIRAVIEGGGFDHVVREQHMGPTMAMVSQLLAKRLDVPIQRSRNAVVALTHLVMRFVTNSMEDNRIALGAETTEEARERVLEIIISTGCFLLGVDA